MSMDINKIFAEKSLVLYKKKLLLKKSFYTAIKKL